MNAIQQSHLFTLRLWVEELGEGEQEWRVRLQNVASGEACYFRDWPTLVNLLLAMLPNSDAPHTTQPDGECPEPERS